MPAFTAPFVASLAAIAALLGVGWMQVSESRVLRARRVGLSALAAAALVACFVASRSAAPPDVLADAILLPGQTVEVPPLDRPHSVLIHGKLPAGAAAAQSTVRYTVAVEDEVSHEEVVRHEGTLDAHWVSGRAGKMQTKSLVVKEDDRIDLPATVANHPLAIKLIEERGQTEGPLHALVIPAPLRQSSVWLAFGILGLIAAFGDSIDPKRSPSTFFVCALGAFSLMLPSVVTPTGPVAPVAMVTVLGAVLGAPVAWAVRRSVMKVRGGGQAPAAAAV
jgi:hypothetical protein